MIFSPLLAAASMATGVSVPAAGQAAEQAPAAQAASPDRSTQTGLFTGAPETASGADVAQEEGEIVVTGKAEASPSDPMQALNRKSFEAVRSVDEAVTGPLAREYRQAVPAPVRDGLRNALRNVGEPVVAVNYLLQLKPGKSLETLGRFAINSTAGIAGLFDVAKRRPINLPHRTNGFANTMGCYGVKPGPYMYLPLIGPTTLRDLAGRVGDISLLPLALGGPFHDPAFVAPATTIRLIDERAEADEAIRERRTGPGDPYSLTRSDYLAERQADLEALGCSRRT